MPSKNIENRRRYVREHYARNIEAQRARIRQQKQRWRREVKAWLGRYLADHPCVDCDEDDPVVLEFDHVRGQKKFNIGDAVRTTQSLKAVLAEVAKCEVRCANCHRRRTFFARMAG